MSLATVLRERFHGARADLFVQLMRPRAGATVLDLGGGDGSFAARLAARVPLAVTVADVETAHVAKVRAHGFEFVQLEAGPRLPFADGQFDIVVCNSVIEHVTLPKEECRVSARVPQARWRAEARAAQAAFAREVARVGRGYFVQTPHRHFPIDQHVHLPLVHYLPHNGVCRLVAVTDRFWIKECQGTVDWELLTPRELQALFPGAQVRVERLARLPKSVIAWKCPDR